MFRDDEDEARDSGDILIDSSLRVDINQIRSYISTVSLVQGIANCNSQLQMAFIARPLDKGGRWNRVHDFEKATQDFFKIF